MRTLLILFTTLLTSWNSYKAEAKDYIYERYRASLRYLEQKYGFSNSNQDEDFAKYFAKEYLDNTDKVVYDISISKEGDISLEGEEMSLKKARRKLTDKKLIAPKTVVIMATVIYGEKGKKTYSKLMEAVDGLIKDREKTGYGYGRYPVLCSPLLGWEKIMHQITVQRNERQLTQLVESEVTRPVPTAKPTKVETRATGNNRIQTAARNGQPAQKTPRKTDNKDEKESLSKEAVTETPDRGKRYVVKVNTYLTVRESASTQGKAIGKLTNGKEITVQEVKNGWARFRYNGDWAYVNCDYLRPLERNLPEGTGLKGLNTILKFCYEFLPYAVLVLAALLLFLKHGGGKTVAFLMGLCEMVFAFAFIQMEQDPVPWFCNPSDVGWIMTIVNFLLLSGVLNLQYGLFKGLLRGLELGLLAYIAAFPIIVGMGYGLVTLASDPLTGGLCLFATIMITWFTLLWKTNDMFFALVNTLWIAVTYGGAAALFVKTIPVLITGAIAMILFRAFAEGGKSTRSYSEEYDDTKDSGWLERSADGTPFIRHRDGSSTQLHDDGVGGLFDSKGRRWNE